MKKQCYLNIETKIKIKNGSNEYLLQVRRISLPSRYNLYKLKPS